MHMWLSLLLLLSGIGSGLGECFFPFEYHGSYAVQMAQNQYSEVVIEINKIFPYGLCHRRIENNLILRDSSNGCLRCFHLAIRSANVLQLHTRDPQSSCATNLNDTFKLCPTLQEMSSPESMNRSRVHELMMYKVKNAANEPHVQQVYCPISGRFSFSYDVNDGTENSVECPSSQSQISNCPFGFGLHLRFKDCAIRENLNMTFECLGDWEDGNGNKFVALLDTDATDERPRYRCAMYRHQPGSGRIYMALSSDSSCHHNLESARRGYEQLVLDAKPTPAWPPAVRQARCALPDWAQGQWQHSQIDGDAIVYKDVKHFKTHTARCISGGEDGKYVIFSRSQCGEENYNCIWLKRRGDNVMEFQLGLSPGSDADDAMCEDHQFLETEWITEGRQEPLVESACPVAGEYEGIIPNTDGQLGAKLYSDCNNPGIMFYSVVSGANSSEVYEEREYRCLGTWPEGDVMYTYTQRRDVLSYECFAGRVMADGRVYIGEAGTDESCRRRVEPTRTGMLITTLAACYSSLSSTGAPDSSTEEAVTARPLPPHPTRRGDTPVATARTTTSPWKPITGRPGQQSLAVRSSAQSALLVTMATLLLAGHLL